MALQMRGIRNSQARVGTHCALLLRRPQLVWYERAHKPPPVPNETLLTEGRHAIGRGVGIFTDPALFREGGERHEIRGLRHVMQLRVTLTQGRHSSPERESL